MSKRKKAIEDDTMFLRKECCTSVMTYFFTKKAKEGHDLLAEKETLGKAYDDNFYEILDEMASKGTYVQDIIDFNRKRDAKFKQRALAREEKLKRRAQFN